MTELIIEVRGGVVVETYSNRADVKVTLIDWDDHAGGDVDGAAREFPTVPIIQMPSDTAAMFERAKKA